jgi:hypothetical protein
MNKSKVVFSTSGHIFIGVSGKLHYVDELGNERKLYAWIDGTRFNIALDTKSPLSVEGELVSAYQIPTRNSIESIAPITQW